MRARRRGRRARAAAAAQMACQKNAHARSSIGRVCLGKGRDGGQGAEEHGTAAEQSKALAAAVARRACGVHARFGLDPMCTCARDSLA